ncbi:MAG: phage holin family protein [Gaiellales bacterium]|nr:phage holin family protein [Gaiellales bacterium]
MRLLVRWAVNTLAILAVTKILPAFQLDSIWIAVLAALLLGILNTFLRPILVLVTLPINILTLGLFTLVLNGLILQILDWILGDHMQIDGFWWAVLAALLISVITWLVNIIIGGDKRRSKS